MLFIRNRLEILITDLQLFPPFSHFYRFFRAIRENPCRRNLVFVLTWLAFLLHACLYENLMPYRSSSAVTASLTPIDPQRSGGLFCLPLLRSARRISAFAAVCIRLARRSEDARFAGNSQVAV